MLQKGRSRAKAPCRLGIQLLTTASAILITIGLAQALVPLTMCAGLNINGCESEKCQPITDGVCASKDDWAFGKRVNTPYRKCTGAVGKCGGYSAQLEVCKNYFYGEEFPDCDPHGDPDCSLTTKVAGCPKA